MKGRLHSGEGHTIDYPENYLYWAIGTDPVQALNPLALAKKAQAPAGSGGKEAAGIQCSF